MTTPEEKAREILKSEPLSDHDREMLAPKIAKALRAERARTIEECAKVADAKAARARGVFIAAVWTAEELAASIRDIKEAGREGKR